MGKSEKFRKNGGEINKRFSGTGVDQPTKEETQSSMGGGCRVSQFN
jgi:hypothetical protein